MTTVAIIITTTVVFRDRQCITIVQAIAYASYALSTTVNRRPGLKNAADGLRATDVVVECRMQ